MRSGYREPLTLPGEERVGELCRKFGSTRVVVLGDVILDVYLWGNVQRISPEAPVPVCRIREETVMLGGAANAAVNIAALGGEAVLVGVVGDDESGDELRGKLEEAGLSVDTLICDGGRPTTRKTRVFADTQQVVRVDREESEDVKGEVAERIIGVLEGALRSSAAIILQDYNKGTLSPGVIRDAVSMARERGLVISVDPKFRNFFEYRGVTLFKPNLREMEHAFGSFQPGSPGLEGLMKSLKVRTESKNILLTRGEDGMILLDEDGAFTRVPAISHEVYDVSGAGDTVISTATLAMAAGGTAREGAILANYAASVEVQRRGVRTVTREEIMEAMRRHRGPIET
jgi:D-beta-D-heptose 7-phosphate kinase/D-beta-D-heptose 1-phosphate adenosyltransferase